CPRRRAGGGLRAAAGRAAGGVGGVGAQDRALRGRAVPVGDGGRARAHDGPPARRAGDPRGAGGVLRAGGLAPRPHGGDGDGRTDRRGPGAAGGLNPVDRLRRAGVDGPQRCRRHPRNAITGTYVCEGRTVTRNTEQPTASAVRPAVVLLGVIALAVNLRAALAAYPPLLETVRADLGIGAGAAGLVQAGAVLMMAV